MQVYVLDKDYSPDGIIDAAESTLWNKKYNDIGEAEIYLPCNTDHLALLKRGKYLYRYDDDMVCKIEKREIETDVENGDYLIVHATDLCNILAGRIVRWQIVYSGTVAGFIEKVLTDNVINPEQTVRQIPNFEFMLDTSNGATFDETIDVSTFAEDLLQLILTTCKTYNYGFRLTYDFDAKKLVFRLYKGKNKALPSGEKYVEFSPQFSNILSSNYVEDGSNLKNVAYVGYKGDDEQTHLLSLYNGAEEPTGEARREIYVDGTSVSRDINADALAQMFPNMTLVKDGSNYVAKGENLLKIRAFSAANIKSEASTLDISNAYGTTLSTTEPAQTLEILQSQHPSNTDHTHYSNGYFCVDSANFAFEDGVKYAVSFDIEILSNPLNASYLGLLANGYNRSFAYFTQTKQRVSALLLWKASDERKFIEIRNAGMSLIVSNFCVKRADTLTEESAEYVPYVDDMIVATSTGEGEDEKITVTDEAYIYLVRALGENALAEHVEKTEFSGNVDTIDTYEYKTDYNIGDIVKVVNEHGIGAEARITEIAESYDNEDGYVVEPVFEYIN